jgi:arylsulfatase A-like enzyme
MNVVVIIADQLRADHLGFEGKVPVRTPHMDELASESVVMSQAFVANPVCMPNRATIMTGRWPSAHGLRTNGLPLDWQAETFVRNMRNAGWKTAAVGKLHLQPMGWPFEEFQQDEIQAAMPDLWARAMANFGERFVSWEDYERHAGEVITLPPDYYGFDDVSLTVGHGDRISGNYVQWARSRGLDPMTQAGVQASNSVSAAWNQVYESAVPATLHPTTYVTDEAIDRLEQYAKRDEPFCLYVSFPDPHHPFAPPREYFHRHSPDAMPLPQTFFDDHRDSPNYIKTIIGRRGVPNEDPTMTWAPTEEQFRQALAAELGSIEFIDHSVGRILGSLDSLGLRDDTIVVFTADHGDVFGDHGLMLKHFTHYRGVIRVPLLVRSPGVRPGVRQEMVSSADIAPTLLELSGVPGLARAQGRSLAPLLSGSTDWPRAGLLIEEDQPFGLEDLPGPVRMRTFVTQDLRLTEIAGSGISECFDLREDPEERRNLASEPEGVELLTRGRDGMLQQVIDLLDSSTIPFHAA